MRSLSATLYACISAFSWLLAAPCTAQGMRMLDDASLSAVRGRDGVSFDLANFSLSGNAKITYFAPSPSTASGYIGNLFATRSDDTANPFSDPYRLDLLAGPTGFADIIYLAFPQNTSGLARWQFAYDWGINANGSLFDGGSTIFKDLVFYGGGLQWSTPVTGEGTAFGISLRMDIGNVLLRPRGRDNIALANPASVAEQLNFSGVHIGAAGSDGTPLNTPWRIADVSAQPGIVNAVTDAAGNPSLHFGIGWPDANGAALGSLVIDNIAFKSDVTGNLDLGSSRVGTIQIQYLDVKFRH